MLSKIIEQVRNVKEASETIETISNIYSDIPTEYTGIELIRVIIMKVMSAFTITPIEKSTKELKKSLDEFEGSTKAWGEGRICNKKFLSKMIKFFIQLMIIINIPNFSFDFILIVIVGLAFVIVPLVVEECSKIKRIFIYSLSIIVLAILFYLGIKIMY